MGSNRLLPSGFPSKMRSLFPPVPPRWCGQLYYFPLYPFSLVQRDPIRYIRIGVARSFEGYRVKRPKRPLFGNSQPSIKQDQPSSPNSSRVMHTGMVYGYSDRERASCGDIDPFIEYLIETSTHPEVVKRSQYRTG